MVTTILLMFAALQADADMGRAEIPLAYVGRWETSASLCRQPPGADSLLIGRRTMRYDHSHYYLRISALNEATSPPSFHGRFDVREGLTFSEATLRLEPEGAALHVSRDSEEDDDPNPLKWWKCAAK